MRPGTAELPGRLARQHPGFDIETLEYVVDHLISDDKLPSALRYPGIFAVLIPNV